MKIIIKNQKVIISGLLGALELSNPFSDEVDEKKSEDVGLDDAENNTHDDENTN